MADMSIVLHASRRLCRLLQFGWIAQPNNLSKIGLIVQVEFAFVATGKFKMCFTLFFVWLMAKSKKRKHNSKELRSPWFLSSLGNLFYKQRDESETKYRLKVKGRLTRWCILFKWTLKGLCYYSSLENRRAVAIRHLLRFAVFRIYFVSIGNCTWR